MDGDPLGLQVEPGLCGRCRHAILRATRRGTSYLRCGLAATDERFAKYPRLPLRACDGYAPVEQAGPAGSVEAR